MPLVNKSSYTKSFNKLRNGHLQTILPSLLRTVDGVNYQRERIITDDQDFLDLDWLKCNANKLVILSHGLEGASDRHYIKSCAKYFHNRGYDVLAWNYRSCSGEMNKKLRLYHHGVTDDLETVINHAISNKAYHKIALIGYSMGGSTSLKYLGEGGSSIPKQVVAAVTFSVPCNLWDSAQKLTENQNKFYKNRFLKKLIKKIKEKHKQFPDQINIEGIDDIKSFAIFDEKYTAPLHGFKNAKHFYHASTSDSGYKTIQRPALIVNALNDPMLGKLCYPYEACKNHKYITLETPRCGGHVDLKY